MTRNDVLTDAVDKCMRELYKYAQPSITWDNFIEENKLYLKLEKEWKDFRSIYENRETNPKKWDKVKAYYEDWIDKSITECIGPRPFEFYYLPKEILKDIADSYVDAYKIDSHQELLDTINVLKDYCVHPIKDKWIEGKDGDPGYSGYENPDNLKKEINTYLDLKFPLMDPERAEDAEDFENKLNTAAKELQDKFFEFLDMAGNFFKWNRELNSFNMSVYLGASPNSNKEKVIENWKKHRGMEIEIDEEKIKKDYYGDEEDDD